MSQRRPRSLEIPGVTHGSVPIPAGARVGNVIYSSGISGKDPATGKLPADVESQARFAFKNLCTLLENGGATTTDVVKVTAFIKDDSARAPINVEWLKLFPDEHDRPARHSLVYDLQHGMLLQLEVVAVITGQ